jgi:carboxymethylenebutenolidase
MCLDRESEACGSDRRDFLFGAATGLVALGVCGTEGAAQSKKPPPTRILDDPRAQHGKVTFKHGGKETFDGYLARPKAKGSFPAVLVIAGSRITEEYIPNTCVALALAGFVGLAPNIFHPLTEGAWTREAIDKALKDHTDYDVLQDIQVGADYLKTQPFVKEGGLGILGFCYGGRMALCFAARSREVDAVVSFHPGPCSEKEIARLKAPVQLHHGTADRSVDMAKTKKLEEVLKAQKTPVKLFLYEGVDHGFLAYTRPMYHPDAAMLAWKRAVEFLGKHLTGR